MKSVRFIDLFAGIGGIRIGFEQSVKEAGLIPTCLMTSEIKPHAIQVLNENFPHENIVGDISKVPNSQIPDFDFLLAGFPCQPFSAAGNRHGFVDTRGTLFFEIERILSEKKPFGFILENVEGLIKHDLENKNESIGRTLKTIINHLEALDYKVSFNVLNAKDFGVPQARKRVFIVGTKTTKIDLNNFEKKTKKIKSILETNQPLLQSKITDLLLKHYPIKELYGKSIKDKRGGTNNIHSWDIGLKGSVSEDQKSLLTQLFKQRRKKHWADEIGIKWMDGMPLTLKQIETFFPHPKLEFLLEDLVKKGYLAFRHPKMEVTETTDLGSRTIRKENTHLPKGYNIVSGKLSFGVNAILNPEGFAPTLVATDMEKLVVPDGDGLRRITVKEGLKFFGFPVNHKMNVKPTEVFDLLGNTVAVPVVKSVADKLVESFSKTKKPHKANPPQSITV